MFKHKRIMIFGILMMLFLINGCSDSTAVQDKDLPTSGIESKEVASQSISKLESDSDLAQQLEAENGIENVMVQVVEGEKPALNVDIVINNEQKLAPDEVINKYSAIIKEKYPDRPIDIIVAKDGKLLKQTKLN